MIVCSCNVFTDHDVRKACNAVQMPPRTPGQVYGCLGCSAQCGRCALTIRKIMDEALGACARACCSGCPHSEAHGHSAAPVAGSEVDLVKVLVPEIRRVQLARPAPAPRKARGAGERVGAGQHVHAASVL